VTLSVTFAILLWLVAAFWLICGLTALRGLPRVPNLCHVPPLPVDQGSPAQVTVIIPARNEASAIEATLRSLLAQTIPIDIIAIDDRSTEETGVLMDRIAAEPLPPGKSLRVLHVHELPAGWLGKPHAMAFAARHAITPWLLFTDADVLFAPDVLARALRFAQPLADHFVLMPTLILKTPGERSMATFFESLSLLWWRPWRIASSRTRDSIGIGAFNLIRAHVYRAVGGFEAQRFQILDDVRLGVEVKRGGYRQHIAFGRELIRLHWAPGALGMARNLTKNLFAGFGFNPALLLGACLGLALICYAPIAGLFLFWPLRLAALLSLAIIALHYRLAGRYFSGLSTAWAFTLPFTAVLVLYAMLRSMILTLVRRGIVWRGTFYPLADLRRHSGRLR
jgi:glycosyltransferase involved in cell wall biosynthesis